MPIFTNWPRRLLARMILTLTIVSDFSAPSASGILTPIRKYELFTDFEDEGIEPTGAGSVKETKISEVWENPGDKMLFLFDYGDNWLFIVELADFGVVKPKTKYPRIVKKVGQAPEQYPEVEE